MAILDNKITSGEIANAHVQKQPNRLTGTPQENKAVFDTLPELIAEKYNSALEEIKTEIDEKDTNLANVRAELEEEIHSDPTIDPETQKKSAYNKEFENTAANIAMNGTASSGFLDTVARGDHVHPTDTSRASQSDMTSIESRMELVESSIGETIEIVDILNNTTAVISVTEGNLNGTVNVKKKPLSGDGEITTTDVPVHGLGSGAFADSDDYVTERGTKAVTYTMSGGATQTSTWYYTRFNSGWVEAWGRFELGSASSSTAKSATIPTPFTMSNTDYYVTATSEGAWLARPVRCRDRTTTTFGSQTGLENESANNLVAAFHLAGFCEQGD